MHNIEEQKAVSSFWLGPYCHWHFTDESPETMVIVTKVVSSIEKLVRSFDQTKKISLRLATDVKARSNWAEGKIVLPPRYLWEKSHFPSFADLVDIWTGMALHEVGHIVLSDWMKKSETHEFIIMHIVEDFWIERWMTLQYPGFRPYVEKLKQFQYGGELYLGDDLLSQKINDLIYAVNRNEYEVRFQESLQAIDILQKNWDEARQQDNISDWDRYAVAKQLFSLLFPKGVVFETDTTKELHLVNPNKTDPIARSTQMKDVDLEIPSPFLLTGKVKVDQMLQFHTQVKGGKKITWASEQMMESWLKEEGRFFETAKHNTESSLIKQARVDEEGLRAYESSYKRIKPSILKLREIFKTVNTPRIYETIGLNQGSLDEEALYRTKYSTNIFKTVEERHDAIDEWEIILLIDQSKSTEQPYSSLSHLKRYEVATDIGVLFVEALKNLKPVHLTAYAYSTATHTHLLQLDELYKSTTKNTFRLGMIEPKHATPEFLALKEVTLRMAESIRIYSRKLIVVVSDGEPDDYQYGGGAEHKELIQQWIEKWSKRNVSFVHISIAEDTKASELYPTSIAFESDYRVLAQKVQKFLTATLRKK